MKFLALVFIALYLFSFLGYSKGMEEDPNSLDEMDEDLEFRTVDRTSTQQLEGSYRRPPHRENSYSPSGSLFLNCQHFHRMKLEQIRIWMT